MTAQKSESTKNSHDQVLEREISTTSEEWEWENFLFELEMLGLNEGNFRVTAKSVGWRNVSGEKVFSCDSALDFIQEVNGFSRPGSVFWTWRFELPGDVFEDENKPIQEIEIRLYHHDSPTGEFRSVERINRWELQGIKPYTVEATFPGCLPENIEHGYDGKKEALSEAVYQFDLTLDQKRELSEKGAIHPDDTTFLIKVYETPEWVLNKPWFRKELDWKF